MPLKSYSQSLFTSNGKIFRNLGSLFETLKEKALEAPMFTLLLLTLNQEDKSHKTMEGLCMCRKK